jgi:hypothetical protein
MMEDLFDKGDTLKKENSARIPKLPRLHAIYPSKTSLLDSSPSKRQLIPTSPVPKKRQRLKPNSDIKKRFLDEYSHHFQGPPACHVPSTHPTKSRGVCIYCSYLFSKNIQDGVQGKWKESVKRTTNVCAYCSEMDASKRPHFLCKHHFFTFHGTE